MVGILHTTLEGTYFLWLKVLVGNVSANRIVEFGDRRHTQRCVVAGIEFQSVTNAIACVDAWIDLHAHAVPRVLHSHETCRECEAAEQYVVFNDETDIGAVDAVVVVAVGSADMVRIVQWFTEVSAEQVFVAQLCTNGCTTENPVEIAVEVYAKDVGAMIVERIFIGSVAEKFEAVVAVIPINGRAKMEAALLRLCLQGGVGLQCVLKLVVPFCAVECV